MRIDLELPTENRSIFIDRETTGRSLTDILRHEDIPLNTRCGERHLCKSCTVEVLRNGRWISEAACQLTIDADVAVRVPAQALLAYEPQVLSDYRINVPFANDPLFDGRGYGIAVDIGTTTIAVSLLRMADGAIVGKAAGFNRQMHYGDDVLTRINLCLTAPEALGRLQRAIIEETIVPLVDKAVSEAGISTAEIRGYVLAGNTTMLHLAAGVNPGSMGYAPFTPRFLDHRRLAASNLGLRPDHVPVHFLPGVAAYVGADITCGILASGLAYDQSPSLLVDVGTNGEIVLNTGDRMFACATAAGPAFEGSGLRCGVRAGDGAISHFAVSGVNAEPQCQVVGPAGTKPTGMCGSAYIDFLAEGRRHGLLNGSGRMQGGTFDELVIRDEFGLSFKVAMGQGKRPIVVAESDIARLLQAKAAIAAGILTLLNRAGIDPAEIRNLYLAGGFGMHLHIANAIRCGLLPGFRTDQIQLVGNSSLAGATMAVLDQSVLKELGGIAENVEIVELNLDPGFEDTYLDQLALED